MKMTDDYLLRTILEMGDTIASQDNRSTSFPLYIVYERYPKVGNDDYSSDGYYIWVEHESGDYHTIDDNIESMRENLLDMISGGELEDHDTYHMLTEEHIKLYATYDELSETLEDLGYERTYMEDEKIVSAVFFTEKAAENYIESRSHSLTKPYIYVTSMHDSIEMRTVREFILRFRKMFSHHITCKDKKLEVSK